MKLSSLLCLLLLIFVVPASPQSLSLAKDKYYAGIYGDKTAGAQADQLFSSLHKTNPSDPLVTVYFGSLRLLEAQHTWALWRKNALSKEGIRLMDQAAGQAPGNLEIRFVRAATEINLPSFFGRKQQAEDEFTFLAGKAAAASREGKFEPRLAAAALLYFGNICQQQSDPKEAVQAWKAAVRVAPQSHAGRTAAKLLGP